MVAPDLSRSALPPCEVGFWIPHCGRCGFRIPGNGSPDSLSVEFGFRIPIVCRIPDNSSWITDSKAQDAGSHKQTSEKKIYSGFHKQRFVIPESGVPDTGQSTDSYWIVGTQVSAADFAGRRTRQRTEILTRM